MILLIYAYAKLRGKGMDMAFLFQGILGSIILLSLFQAILQTHGVTVLLVFVPLLIYYGYLHRNKEAHSFSQLPLSILWVLFGLSFFLFTWSFFCLVNFTDQVFYIPSGTTTQANDFFIYAQRAKYLGETGQENYFGLLNQLDSTYQGLSPYHYLELWLGSACSRLLGISHVYSLGLIVKPLFYLATATGLLAIIEHIHPKIRPIHILWVIALFFVSGLYFKSPWLNLGEFNLSMLSYRFKMVVYYPFIVGFVLMVLKGKEKHAFVFLGALIVSSVVVFPAVLGGGILYFMYRKFTRQEVSIIPLLILSFTLCAIGIFYLLTPSPGLQSSLGVEQNELLASFSLSSIPQIFLKFLANIGNLVLVFLSSFTLMFWAWKRKNLLPKIGGELLLLMFAILIAGAFSYALLKDFENAIQLFYNPAIAILNVALIYILILIGKEKKYRKWIGIFLGLSIANQVYLLGPKLFKHHTQAVYSAEYLEKIEKLANNHELSDIGAVLKDEKDYTSSFSKITYAYTGAYYLLYYSGEISCLSLSDHNIPISPEDERNNRVNRNSGIFYQYVEEQKRQNEFRSIPQSQLSFIQKNKINFLVCSKNVNLSPDVESIIKEKIEDSLSGEYFLLLQNP